MFIELHLLQNFAPSNLNRDDTGSPKDCEFGGYRRARLSSQCLKRAVRMAFRQQGLLSPDVLGVRTKRIVEQLVRRVGHPEEEAAPVIRAMLQGVKLTFDKDGKSQYLLYLGASEIERLAALCREHWEQLRAITTPAAASDTPAAGRARGSARDVKRSGVQAVPAAVVSALHTILDGSKAADVALFGRMLADLPEHNVDAACQVAHALSTHKAGIEFDFYTAVDDLKPEGSAGADMLGTVEFNSACFYRYANVDLTQLERNLQGDTELARETLGAFLRASVDAIPTGKQNSMAAQNPPSFVLVVVRETGLWSLANAFLKPVRPSDRADLMEGSIDVLTRHWARLRAMYGAKAITGAWAVSLQDGVVLDGVAAMPSVDAVLQAVRNAITPMAAGSVTA